MRFLRLIKHLSGMLLLLFTFTIIAPTTVVNANTNSQGYYYKVVKGDSLVKISLWAKVSVSTIINVNHLMQHLMVGQRILIPYPNKTNTNTKITKDYVIYKRYAVKSGDSFWDLSLKYGLPLDELLNANGLNKSSIPALGQILRIPVHYIAVKATKNSRSGELLDWFTEAQYAFPIGAKATVKDVKTGKTFMIKRTYGAAHADVETITAKDTATMKSIWGGRWSWNKRPVLIIVKGHRIAASAAGMPHAGLDKYPADKNVANRSDHYGYGPNLDKVKHNNMNGHFDLFFLNSRRHVDNNPDPAHQANVYKAAAVK